MGAEWLWRVDDLDCFARACAWDDALPIVLRTFAPGARILDAGCGSGRWVRSLTDRGFRMVGLEHRPETVAMLRRHWPDLEFIEGDCAESPLAAGSFDGALSFGVVEHWPEGPAAPLAELLRVLRPGGHAIVTVPCLNAVRRARRRVWWDEVVGAPRAAARTLLHGRAEPLNRWGAARRHAAHPAWGPFFEYRMTVPGFRREVEDSGFEVIEHLPLGEMDGVYHDMNPGRLLVDVSDGRFHAGRIARALNWALSAVPFGHCHMQAIVARKPSA